ncbi:uncharacterized protein LOC117180346 [Belonocnema kinseyi]|uniref:uncharacterized protein LOC117180346 n=1 Tax=Belonocnema kinseyi TaxID=2817044 RepID=UPI00143DD13F|nr:uncharacterized protein LOC117180346 [Belonocnema kinseyi]
MGVRRCIVFGCKSGQKRGVTKKEKGKKVHFFLVPKAEVELWQRALSRKDIVVKAGHAVCQRHFSDKDILWRKELRGPDGKILGVSADYKIPKLRKGTVPSLCLGITSKLKTGPKSEKSTLKSKESPKSEESSSTEKLITTQSTDDTNNIDRVNQTDKIDNIGNIDHNYYSMHNDYNANSETVNNLHSQIANEKLILNINPQKEVIETNAEVEDSLEVQCKIDDTPLFEIIHCNEKSVVRPFGWCRQNMKYDGKRMVHFCQFIPRMDKGVVQPVCTKQVLVDENLKTSILIMRQQIDKDNSAARQEPLQNIEDLEKLLKLVSSWRLCPGLSLTGSDEIQVSSAQASSVHQDKEGLWRSVECAMFLPEGTRNGSCEKCRLIKKVIARRMLRLKVRSQLQRLRVTLSEPQQRKLDEMRKEMRTLRRGRDRALARIKILKEQRLLDLQKFNSSQRTLEQLILETNLAGNQKLVMLEIMAASRQTDTRARRYTKVWIAFCLTLHRRSPVTYRFLRANNILPLPTPRTVLRFAQHNPPVTDTSPAPDGKLDTVEETIEDVILEGEEFEDEIPQVGVETEVS